MVHETVAKRTRLQRAINQQKLFNEIKKSRKVAKREFRKQRVSERLKINGGGDDLDHDDHVVMVIDKAEFDKKVGVSGLNDGGKSNVGFVDDHDHGGKGDDQGDNVHDGDGDGGSDSDSSVEIIRESWNPYAFNDDLDDDDSQDIDGQNDNVHCSGEENASNLDFVGENENDFCSNVNNGRVEGFDKESVSDFRFSSSSGEEDGGEANDNDLSADEPEVSSSSEERDSGCGGGDDDGENEDSHVGTGGGGGEEEESSDSGVIFIKNYNKGRMRGLEVTSDSEVRVSGGEDDEENSDDSDVVLLKNYSKRRDIHSDSEVQTSGGGDDVENSENSDVVLLKNDSKGLERGSELNCKSLVQTRVYEGKKLLKFPENNAGEDDFIGRRTRSRFKPKYRRKTIKDGTVTCPVNLDEITSSGSEDGEGPEVDELNDGDHRKYQLNILKSQKGVNGVKSEPDMPRKNKSAIGVSLNSGEFCDEKGHGRHKHHVLKPEGPVVSGVKRRCVRPPKDRSAELQPPSKRKRVQGLKDDELQKILDTICENGGKHFEDLMSSNSSSYLRLKFSFGLEKVEPLEKSEEEKELDSLWKDMDIALGARDIGSDICFSDNNQLLTPSDHVDLPEKRCFVGNHHLILDEEVGIVCKLCSFVYIEIRDLTPEFNKDPFGKSSNRGYKKFLNEDALASDSRFHFHDKASDVGGDHSPPQDTHGTVWELIPGIWKTLHPHQREGFEFIWRNIAGGIKREEFDKPTKYDLGGCIICHAPGTGKTLLAIAFLQSYLKQYPKKRPVIIAPRSMLLTWEEEFARWSDIPFFNLNVLDFCGEEDLKICSLLQNSRVKNQNFKAKFYSWQMGKGVLGISYRLFEQYAGNRGSNDDSIRQALLKKSDILVLDEGHTPRNAKSLIYKVFANVETKQRIILSGTPFQNNFQELMNTISLVRPDFVDPVLAGKCADYQMKRGRISHQGKSVSIYPTNCTLEEKRRIEELRKRINPFVHVHKGEILRKKLRGLFDSVLVLKPTDLQQICFQKLSNLQNPLDSDYLFSLASVHPYLLLNTKNAPKYLTEDVKSLLEKNKNDLDSGPKVRFLLELVRLSIGEKVLVFSQFLPSLAFIRDMLETHFGFKEGNEVIYMDGQQGMKQRQNFIQRFNDSRSGARVLLASTKACGEGIRLVGASRVVLLDVVWNPSVERQAISRAYRLGQEKDVYVYHLISSKSAEFDKYYRQLEKEHISELVFSSSLRENVQEISTTSKVSVDKILDEMIHNEKMKPMFDKIIYQPKADNLIESFVDS